MKPELELQGKTKRLREFNNQLQLAFQNDKRSEQIKDKDRIDKKRMIVVLMIMNVLCKMLCLLSLCLT